MGTFQVEEIQIAHPRIAPGARPLVLAHVSDLHLGNWRSEHDRLVEVICARDADFVFLTGDMLAGGSEAGILAALCKRLKARHGLFAVRGNWEASVGPPLRDLRPVLAEAGATLLVNEARTVPTEAGRIRIVGVDDLCSGAPDFQEALAGDAAGADFTVLLCHAPLGAFLLPPRHGVDLVLSGHTHGGQIRLPLLTRMVLPACSGPLLSGLHEVNGTRLYINRGLASVGLIPLRLNAPAEVTFLRIVRGAPPP